MPILSSALAAVPALALFMSSFAPTSTAFESCPGCTGTFTPGIEVWVDGYQVSVTPLTGVNPSGLCYFDTTDNLCKQGSACTFGMTVAWVIPSGGQPVAGEWCTQQLWPVATLNDCEDTGTYSTSGSNVHRERIPCGSGYIFEAHLGESVALFGLACTGCVN